MRQHDIAVDPLPANGFDLIHERLVLLHVPLREQAQRNIVTALKPGGWFMLEEFDAWMVNRTATTADPAAAALYDKMRGAMTAVMQQRGTDNTFARTAHERLQSNGLVDAGRRSYAVCTTLLQTGGLLLGEAGAPVWATKPSVVAFPMRPRAGRPNALRSGHRRARGLRPRAGRPK